MSYLEFLMSSDSSNESQHEFEDNYGIESTLLVEIKTE